MSNFKKNALLFLASSMFALCLAEILVRVFVVQETKRLAIYDKELGWRGRPNGDGVYIRLEDSINVPFHYNELGFRDDRIAPRESVSTRIMIVGDSFVENLEINFEQIFPRLVERKLQEQLDPKMDVVAVSSQGDSNAQEVLALRKFGDFIKPNIVLLVVFTGNDFDDNLRRSFAYLDSAGTLVFPPNADSWLKVQSASFQRWLYESSALVFYVKNLIATRTALQLEDGSKVQLNESKEYPFNITGKLILAAKEETEKRGARFGLLLFTSRKEFEAGDLEKTEFVAGVCKQAGIPLLESLKVLNGEHFFRHDVHFTVRGHELMADSIYEFIAKEFGLMKPDGVAH